MWRCGDVEVGAADDCVASVVAVASESGNGSCVGFCRCAARAVVGVIIEICRDDH